MRKNLPWLLLALVGLGLLVWAGCAHTIVQPDGTLAVVGTDVLPGGGEITQDIAGAVVDEAAKFDPAIIIQKVVARDWWGLGAALVGAVGAVVSGFFVRRKIRERKDTAAAVKVAADALLDKAEE